MSTESDRAFVRNYIDATVKLALIALMIYFSFKIIQPFVMLVLWGIILAVALRPLFEKFVGLLGGKRKLAAVVAVLGAVSALVLPVWGLAGSSFEVMQDVAGDLKNDEFELPDLPEKVEGVPVIGARLAEFWALAQTNLKEAIEQTAPLAQQAAEKVVGSITGGLSAVLHFTISFIIAGVFLMAPDQGYATTTKIARSLAGERGEEFAKLSIATIRGVMTGVVGVAAIQAVLATLGMAVIGVPAAGVWGILVLILAIVQLPPILILGPIAAYVFATHDTVPASIFLVWSVLVSFSDGILKPVLMARGVDTPMLVILLGAIGGMMLAGIIGLFVGAVVLSITYALFMAWVEEKNEEVAARSGDVVKATE